jgi:SAM-dependent methyltransferase
MPRTCFADESFDAVLKIEASHQYPDIRRFFAEVARVLRPGVHFLYSDIRRCHQIADREAALVDAPMQMMSERGINDEGAAWRRTRSGRRIYGLAIRPRCCMAQSVWRILLTV